MSCTFNYIEKQNISETEKTRLNEIHVQVFQDAVDSKAFRKFNNKLYTLKNNIQAGYNFVSSINKKLGAKVASIQTSQPGQHFLSVNVLPISKEVQGVLFANEESPEVNYQLKVVALITKNIDKIKQWEKQVQNPPVFWEKLQKDLGIPKEQVNLLKETEGSNIEEKLVNFIANYSYTIEINTSTQTSPDLRNSEFARNLNLLNDEELEERIYNTQHYSNLTVPGGTNYTENEIRIPDIIPSIKGHAQFSTENGIGWFRSDDKENKIVGWKEEDDFLNSETAQYNPITKNDKIIFGHPTIGKSYLKQKGNNDFISLDDDYANEVIAFIDTNRSSETRQEYKGRKPKEYNEFMLNLFDRLKLQAKKEGKRLFVSNTNILKERMSDFDKVITIPKDEFKKRFDARGATYGFEDWKSDIDDTVAKVDKSKVISTRGYLSDLLEGNPKTRRILEVQSDIFQKSRDIKSAEDIYSEMKKSGELIVDCG